MHHGFTLDENEYGVELSRRPQHGYRLHLADTVIAVRLTTGADSHCLLDVGTERLEVFIATRGDDVFVHLDGGTHHLRYRHPLDRLVAQRQGSTSDAIRAPMPGTLIAIRVATGDAVARGQELLVMESMKMETSLVAPRDGVIAAVQLETGAAFERGTVLLSLEALGGLR